MKGPVVAVIDDDESMREALPDLLGTFGCAARAFASAEEFLASDIVETDCLVVDIAMSGFITAQNEDTMILGDLSGPDIVTCLFKPFSDTALEDALDVAL